MDSEIASLPWRPMADFPHDAEIYAVIYREWNVASNDARIGLAQWLDLYGDGGKLCGPWNPDTTPYADGWLPLDELNAHHSTGRGK